MRDMEYDIKKAVLTEKNGYLNLLDAGVYMYNMTDHTIIKKNKTESYHIVYITNGCCDVIEKKRTTRVESGNVIIFKPDGDPIYTLYAKDRTEAYWIDFFGTGVENLLQRANLSDRQVYHVGLDKKIADTFHEITVEKKFNNYLCDIALESMLTKLICDIGRMVKPKNGAGIVSDLSRNYNSTKLQDGKDEYADMVMEEQFAFVFQRFVRKWLEGEINSEALIWNLTFYQIDYLYPWFFVAYVKAEGKIEIPNAKNVIVYKKNENEYAYLVFVEDEKNYSNIIFELMKSNQCIKIGISGLSGDIYDVPKIYADALKAYNEALKGRCSWYGDESETNTYIVQKAIFEMKEYYNEQVSSSMIADKLCVSDSYLRKIFKKEVGMTFHKFLTNFRIERAAQLILLKRYSVEEIALMVGYRDVKYFRKVFTEIMGCNPSEYHK